MASQPTWVEHGCNRVRAPCSWAVAPWLCISQRRLHPVPWFDYGKGFTGQTITGHHPDCSNRYNKISRSSCEQPKRGKVHVFPVKNYTFFIAAKLRMWTGEEMSCRWGENSGFIAPMRTVCSIQMCEEFLKLVLWWVLGPSTLIHFNCPSSVPFPW